MIAQIVRLTNESCIKYTGDVQERFIHEKPNLNGKVWWEYNPPFYMVLADTEPELKETVEFLEKVDREGV